MIFDTQLSSFRSLRSAAKLLLFLCFNFFAIVASAQVELIPKKYDFGMLLRADDNWTDFEIHNSGASDVVIFRVEGPKNTAIKLSAKTIKPGTSEYIRVAVSPKAVGKFKIDLEVFVSSWQKPQTLEVSGESSFVASGLIPCPDFSGNRSTADNEFHISVRDQFRNAPLEDATVEIYNSGRLVEKIFSNQYGETDIKLPYGRYFFSIQSNGSQIDTALYVNAVNNHLLAMLDVKEEVRPDPVQTDEIAKVETEEIPKKYERKERPLPTQPPVTTSRGELPKSDQTDDDNSIFPLSEYKENNLVFLVDVSTSMQHEGRLDLLKIAMVQLVDAMRPTDRFSLIAYSDNTETLIETGGNLDRQGCIDAIMALKAGGGTAGAKAINKAGSVAVHHYIKSGNNQIILATDGAFKGGVDKALDYASKYERKDVKLSVLGIKCSKFTRKQMTELVEVGSGRFVPIESASDAGGKLIDEVKISSAR